MYRFNTYHEDVCNELINSVHEGKPQQAYIFEGAEGLNLLESAKLFAAALTCRNTSFSPCGECPVCKLSYAETNPDIITIDSNDKKSIGVDRIRDIEVDVYTKPFESRRKVYIIKDGFLLTDGAQNAMLKILEEPPEYLVFIILVSSASVLLQTIASRCTKIRFSPLNEEKMREYIKSNHPGISENTDFLIRFSEGIPQKCEKILNDSEFMPFRQEVFRMMLSILSKNRLSAYTVSNFLEENKVKADLIFDLWQSFFRDIILIQNDSKNLIVNADMNDELSKLASCIPDICVTMALDWLFKAKSMKRKFVSLHVLGLFLSFSIKKSLYQG